jgi:hypothetical protein
MTIRPDVPSRISRYSVALALGLAPLAGLALAAGSAGLLATTAHASPCPETRGFTFRAQRPPASISINPMPAFTITDAQLYIVGAGGVQCGPYDRISGFQLMRSTTTPLTRPLRPFRIVHEDAEGNRLEEGLSAWPDSDGSTGVFDGRDPRGLWQVAQLDPGPANTSPGEQRFQLSLALAEGVQPEPAVTEADEADPIVAGAGETDQEDEPDSGQAGAQVPGGGSGTGAALGTGTGGLAGAQSEAEADHDPAFTSDPGQSAPPSESDDGEFAISDEPWIADDAETGQAAPSFPGLPTMPDLASGPVLENLIPSINPQDTSQFIPDGEEEIVSDGNLEAPRWIEAGHAFTVRWDDLLSWNDRVTIVPLGTPDDVLGEGRQNVRTGNNHSRSLLAPDALGTYEVRYVTHDEGRIHARLTVEIRDPHIELTVDDPVYAGRDFVVRWDRRLSRNDRIIIVPHDAPEDVLGEGRQNLRIGNNDSRSLRAPDALGAYEVRYWRNQQERVVGSKLVNVVDPEVALDVPSTAHAGRDFSVGWDRRLSRNDRVVIVPLGSPDDVLGEGRQNVRIGLNDSRSLQAPDALGPYEVRYVRHAQERVVGREIIDVIEPEILVMAPPRVEAGSDFEVTWNRRLSRQDRIVMVPVGSPDDEVGSGSQNVRIGLNDSRRLRAPATEGEYEVRYWRNAQSRPAGRALVTVIPEGTAPATQDAPGSAEDLIALMERLVALAARLDEVSEQERRDIRDELIAFGPSGLTSLDEFVDAGRIAPWQASGFIGGAFDPPPPPAVRPYTGFVPQAAGIPPVVAQEQPVASDGQRAQIQSADEQLVADTVAPTAAVSLDSAPAPAPAGALSAQDERRVIMLIARLEGVRPEEQQPIIDELATYGPAASDMLLEMMQEGLINRSLALRAAAAIEADGETPQAQSTQPAPAQQTAQYDAAQPSGYQVTGVAPNDMLNVRDRPGVPGSTVVGRLAPDARGVVRSGPVQDVGGRDWWHVRHPTLRADGGWVNSAFLAAQTGLAPEDMSYRVTGVAADDALNVRSFPGTDGAIIARIPPHMGGLRWNGESAAVAGGTWWELVHPDLPGGTGWVNARFLEAEEGGVGAAEPQIATAQAGFGQAQDHDARDTDAVMNRLLDTLPQTSSIFPPGNELNPLTKAILVFENEEGVVPHARYRMRYALEGRSDGTGGPPVPYSFVEIERYNLGAAFRAELVQSLGEAQTAPPEHFGPGEHVAFRMEFRPIQGRVADLVAISRRVISDGQAQAERCLTGPCLDLASSGEGAMPWRAHEGQGTGFDRPYEDIRNGVHTPAAMADLLMLANGAARIHDGGLHWTGFEESESVRPGQPFLEIVMDVNLGQDSGVEAVSWYGHLMDDSVAAIWQRAISFPGGGAAPRLITERAFECARGEPGREGLCP